MLVVLCCVQVLLSAKSLDQVHSATRAFFANMCNMCNLQPPGRAANKMRETTRQRLESLMDHALAAASAAAWLHAARQKLKELQVRATVRDSFGLTCLYNAIVICSLSCHRVACVQVDSLLPTVATFCIHPQPRCIVADAACRCLQGVAGRQGDMLPWWRQLAEARTRLGQAGRMWQKGLGELLAQWAVLKKHGLSHAFDELTDLLDMNGYFSSLNSAAAAGLVRGQAAALYG
jgi:hypothetical protein